MSDLRTPLALAAASGGESDLATLETAKHGLISARLSSASVLVAHPAIRRGEVLLSVPSPPLAAAWWTQGRALFIAFAESTAAYSVGDSGVELLAAVENSEFGRQAKRGGEGNDLRVALVLASDELLLRLDFVGASGSIKGLQVKIDRQQRPLLAAAFCSGAQLPAPFVACCAAVASPKRNARLLVLSRASVSRWRVASNRVVCESSAAELPWGGEETPDFVGLCVNAASSLTYALCGDGSVLILDDLGAVLSSAYVPLSSSAQREYATSIHACGEAVFIGTSSGALIACNAADLSPLMRIPNVAARQQFAAGSSARTLGVLRISGGGRAPLHVLCSDGSLIELDMGLMRTFRLHPSHGRRIDGLCLANASAATDAAVYAVAFATAEPRVTAWRFNSAGSVQLVHDATFDLVANAVGGERVALDAPSRSLWPTACAVSSSSPSTVAVGDSQGFVRLVDVASHAAGRAVTIPGTALAGAQNAVRALAFSESGLYVACWQESGSLSLFCAAPAHSVVLRTLLAVHPGATTRRIECLTPPSWASCARSGATDASGLVSVVFSDTERSVALVTLQRSKRVERSTSDVPLRPCRRWEFDGRVCDWALHPSRRYAFVLTQVSAREAALHSVSLSLGVVCGAMSLPLGVDGLMPRSLAFDKSGGIAVVHLGSQRPASSVLLIHLLQGEVASRHDFGFALSSALLSPCASWLLIGASESGQISAWVTPEETAREAQRIARMAGGDSRFWVKNPTHFAEAHWASRTRVDLPPSPPPPQQQVAGLESLVREARDLLSPKAASGSSAPATGNEQSLVAELRSMVGGPREEPLGEPLLPSAARSENPQAQGSGSFTPSGDDEAEESADDKPSRERDVVEALDSFERKNGGAFQIVQSESTLRPDGGSPAAGPVPSAASLPISTTVPPGESPQSQKVLRLHLSSGRNLPNHDLGKQDPFVILSFKGAEQRSKTHARGGASPVWDQAFEFALDATWTSSGPQDVIELVAFDEDTISNDRIGGCQVNLAELLRAESAQVWVPLIDGKQRPAGEISLSATIVDAPQSAPAVPAQVSPAEETKVEPKPVESHTQEPAAALASPQAPTDRTFSLVLHSARNLPNHDIGKQDPFVLARFLGKEQRSKTVKKGGANPEWSQTLTWSVRSGVKAEDEKISVELFDEDLVSNDFIGKLELTVGEVLAGGDAWLPLKNKGKDAGEIRLQASLSTPEQAAAKAPIASPAEPANAAGSATPTEATTQQISAPSLQLAAPPASSTAAAPPVPSAAGAEPRQQGQKEEPNSSSVPPVPTETSAEPAPPPLLPTDSSPSAHLSVQFRAGRNLDNHDVGKQDPYVTAVFRGVKRRGKTIKKGGTAPEWNETLEWELPVGWTPQEVLEVQVWDEDPLRDDLVGSLKIHLSALLDAKIEPWRQILSDKQKPAGEIWVQASVVA